MKGQDPIGESFARNRRALALRDSLGRGTATARVRVVEGYRCEIEDGDWRLVADMGEKSGGTRGRIRASWSVPRSEPVWR